ncbi:adenylyl-sulfate kinase [Pseudomonas sp. BN102]|uniref:adenylyl-sulfate kinase n=1 Tax=Pseudomonas sp. BN102 TaxID=2567886 RepID=UPI002454F3D4|nr:adenylyl-sulfate kinase [Pseudomonas sp. BN102]MDH4612030.1 adenylyl-sulfate kinase [Pseudomonas sp. BN102]
MDGSRQVEWRSLLVGRGQRASLKQQEPCLVWLTGFSGAGKSTLADALERRLHSEGRHTYLLDGDNLRHGLNGDLGFTAQDRKENIRRVGEVAALMVDAGLIVIAAFISPFRSDRDAIRQLLPGRFVEVFVNTPLDVCEQRDPKGLYRKARAGLLKDFTGLDSPFEKPLAAELTFDTTDLSVETAVQQIHDYLRHHRFLEGPGA